MPYINQEKLQTNKIYKTDGLLVDLNSAKNKNSIKVFFTKDGSVESFVNLKNKIKFSPSSQLKVYLPDFKLDDINLKLTKDVNQRNEFYNSLKEFKINYSKIPDIFKLTKSNQSEPIIADFSLLRNSFNNHLNYMKKKPVSSFSSFTKLIKLLTDYLPFNDFNIDTYIEIGNESDSFIEGIIAYLRYNGKEISDILKKLNVYFVTENGFIYHGDYIVDKKLSNNLMLSKLLRISQGSTKDIDQNVEAITLDNITADDKNLLNNSDRESANSKAYSNDDKETLENNKSEEPIDSDPVDPPTDNSDANVAEIEQISIAFAGDIEEARLKQENADFLNKMEKTQSNALSKLEEEANKLAADKTLDPQIVYDDTIINKSLKTIGNNSITSSYYKKQYKQDLVNILKVLNTDPENPMIVSKFEIIDNSSPLTKVDTYKVEFIDKKYKKHHFIVDMPRLSHDGFLLINGNKKFIAKQALPIPVIKETNDRVQITTNYRKTFLYRKGEKTSGHVDKILRFILNTDFNSISKKYGNNFESNIEYPISIHYNYLARKLFNIIINGKNGTQISLNQKDIRTKLDELGYKFDSTKYIPIGYNLINGKPNNILLEEISTRKIFQSDIKSDKTVTKISDNFASLLDERIQSIKDTDVGEAYRKVKPSLSLSFTEIKIVSTSMTLGALIATYKGLIPALDLYKVKYRIEDKRVAKKDSEIILAFKDVYLYIDTEFNTSKEIFVNGLIPLDTQNYKIDETYKYSTIFLDYLEEATGKRNIAKALMNFESSMIDPITKENLIELGMPTTFPELLLYGNDLLGEFEHDRKNNMEHFRIRDTEILNVAFYNALMTSFNEYKRTVRSGVPQPLAVRKDAIIKAIQEMNNVENFSTLNPYLEAELKSKATFKGASGLNSSDAYTAEIRAYDKTMLGLYGVYTPISAEVGVNRSLVLNPKYRSTRGFIEKNFDLNKADQTNLFSIGELLNVFTPIHSDSPRCIMSTTQSKHITPTKEQHSYLVGNASDKALAHMIGQDFAYSATDDGVVETIDEKKQLCIIRYKDNTTGVIDFSKKAAENIGSGFYIQNKLDLRNFVKKGYKFKKGEILAYDNNFFKETLEGSIGFAAGTLSKVAVMPLAETFEDSAVITDKLIDDMSSDIINSRQVVVSKNTRIIKMAKPGDKVEVNDPLMIFEEVGSDEKTALAALEKLDTSSKATIEELARTTAKAKFAGEIYDMNIYYNCELEEMHPTLMLVVQSYIDKYKAKAKIIDKSRNDEFIPQPSTDKINSDKIFGNDISGVVIEYLIKHVDKMKVGDKLTFSVAAKCIVAETITLGKEPYSEYRPEEEVSAMLSPMSLVARMIPDIYFQGFTNKVLIELKRQVVDIMEE